MLLLLAAMTALPLNFFGQSLWRDEASSVWFARMPLTTLLGALCDPHPPGYYLLLKLWLAGGAQEFWLRLLSLGAAILAVALSYRLALELWGRRYAWLTALLLALHPLQSWYSSEVRVYTLIQSLGVLLVWLGWRLIQAERWPGWREPALYGLAGIIALGVDYVALQPWGLLQLLWLASGRPQPWRWLSLQGVILVGAALLWLNPSQLAALQHGYHAVFIAVQATRAGFELTPAGAALVMQVALAGAALIAGAIAWYWPSYSACRVRGPLLLFLVGSGWLALLLLAGIPRAFTIKRQLVVLLPYLALLMAYSLAQLPRPRGEWVAGLGLLITLLFLPAHHREPWRTVISNLSQPGAQQASLVWVDELAAPVFDYYLNNSSSRTNSIRWAPLIGRELPQLPTLTPETDETLWLVTAESPYHNLIALLPPLFHHQYRLLAHYHEPGIGLYQYQRQPLPAGDSAETPAQLAEAQSDNPIAQWGLLLPSPLDNCQTD